MLQTTTKPLVCIQSFKTGEDGIIGLERMLNDMSPGYVIMYHCNVTATRQLEEFEAKRRRNVERRMKVFFMLHSQTAEEQSYLTNLRREKQAFDLLIETKAVLF